MANTSTHFKVPFPEQEDRATCLGPAGASAHIMRVMRAIHGRWKLPILFRLYAEPSMRTSLLLRDIPGVSQKMLTQHLRDLVEDGLVERLDFSEKPLRVEYRLTGPGRQLLLALSEIRDFAVDNPAVGATDPTEL